MMSVFIEVWVYHNKCWTKNFSKPIFTITIVVSAMVGVWRKKIASFGI